jgi:fructosamine-3-kinase
MNNELPPNPSGNNVSEEVNWGMYLEQKLLERVNGCKNLLNLEIYDKAKNLIEELKPIIEIEAQGQPVLIHRDIYLENFIMCPATNQAVLIDYAMVKGGRPFYDLAKFYILDLYNHPEQRDNFLKGYQKYVPIPSDFNERMRLYLLKESLGMIHFFHSIDKPQYRNHAIKCLEELINKQGVIGHLIQ